MKTTVIFLCFALCALYSYGVTYTEPGTYAPFEGQTITIQQTNDNDVVYSIEFSNTSGSITLGPITQNMPTSEWFFYSESKYRVWAFDGIKKLTFHQHYYRGSGIYSVDLSTNMSMNTPLWVIDQIPQEVADGLPASFRSQLRNTKIEQYAPQESIQSEAQQSGAGYPPQGVGSPDP